jgi:hypothetical protein
VRHAVPGVAGVVDDDVEPAELVDGLLHELVGNPRLGQVAAKHRGVAGDLGSGLLGDVAVQVVDQHTRTLLGEQLRRGAPDAPGRAGDDGRLSVEDSHWVSPFCLTS